MQHHNSFSIDSKNEFIQSPSLEAEPQYSSFMSFMKDVMRDPFLKQAMQTHVQNKLKNSSIIENKSIFNGSSANNQNEPRNAIILQEKRPGKDVLSRYMPKPNVETLSNVPPSNPKSKDSKTQKVNSLEQTPIQSTYISQRENLRNSKDSPTNNNFQNMGESNSMYQSMEDRPIKGIKKDFLEYVKEMPGLVEESEEAYDQKKEKGPANFLKRGSRQHLSNARDKSQTKTKVQIAGNNEESDQGKLTSRSNNRSISQNRVLGKRQDKSTNKGTLYKNGQKMRTEQDSIVKIDKRDKTPTKSQIIMKNQPIIPKKPQKTNLIPQKNSKAQVSYLNEKKKGKNVFNDDSPSESEHSEVSQDEDKCLKNTVPSNSQAYLKKTQIVEGVFVTNEQLEQIKSKYGSIQKSSSQQKYIQLKNKYTDLCNLIQAEREELHKKIEQEREQFEQYKANEINKLKNDRRVMERQVKSSFGNQNSNKEKEELQLLKKQLEREKDQCKKKDKTNKIIIQKYKKQIEELKYKLERQVTTNMSEKYCNSEHQTQEINKKSQSNLTIGNKYDSDGFDGNAARGSINMKKKNDDIKNQRISPDFTKAKPSPATPTIKNEKKPQEIKNIQIQTKNKQINNCNFNRSQSESSEELQKEEEEFGEEIVEWNPSMKLSDLTKINLNIKMVNEKMINSLFKYSNGYEFKKYKQMVKQPKRVLVNSQRSKDGKITNIYSDNIKQVIFQNGTKKQTLQDGYAIVYFKNGDIKQKLSDGSIIYYFKDKQVDQITLTNGVNIYRFDNNQVEFHFNDGKYIEIRHPDGTIKILGTEIIMRR